MATTYHGIYGSGGALKRWYNGVMTRGDLVIANSDFTRRHLMAEHAPDPSRVVVIPEGIDTDGFDPSRIDPERISDARHRLGLENDRRPVLLVAARLTSWKGQALAIEALARLRSEPAPVLVLAGGTESAEYQRSLRALAERLGVFGRVRFAGAMDDMPAVLGAADLVLAPSLKPESFGRGVVEAMAMGRIVVASNLGAHQETVQQGQSGWLVAPGDVAAWASAIDAALSLGPEQRARIGAAARTRAVADYDLRAMTRATFEAYRAVLDAR